MPASPTPCASVTFPDRTASLAAVVAALMVVAEADGLQAEMLPVASYAAMAYT